MSGRIVEAMTAIVDQLTAAGIRAVIDERDVNPPCTLLNHPVLAYRFGKGGWTAEWSLWVIVPDSGRSVALDNLDDLMAAVQVALRGAVVRAVPISVTGLDGSPPLPAYDMTWSDTIR